MDIPTTATETILEDAISRDRTTARRVALLNHLLQERYLTREQLIIRVEGKLGRGCFGDLAWVDTFFRDMQVVRRALRAAGYRPAYSRSQHRPGYYLQEEPAISDELAVAIQGAIAEVDPAQIAVFKRLSPAQRFTQGCSISNLTRQVLAHRQSLRERAGS